MHDLPFLQMVQFDSSSSNVLYRPERSIVPVSIPGLAAHGHHSLASIVVSHALGSEPRIKMFPYLQFSGARNRDYQVTG